MSGAIEPRWRCGTSLAGCCLVGTATTRARTRLAVTRTCCTSIPRYLGHKRDCQDAFSHFTGDPHYDPIGEFTGPVHASVLDFGTEPTGHHLQVLSSYFDVRCITCMACATTGVHTGADGRLGTARATPLDEARA